jgi:hypothetical protein
VNAHHMIQSPLTPVVWCTVYSSSQCTVYCLDSIVYGVWGTVYGA